MKGLIVKAVGTALAFYLTDRLVGGFTIESTLSAFAIASLIFIVFNAIIKPIIKLLLLPINLLTLGLFHWLINVIVLYLFDLLYDGVAIVAYRFEGYSSSLINLPPANINLFWTLVISSFAISIFYSFYESIFKE